MDDSKLRAVPEGWKLVPIEPTSEMMDDAFDNISLSDAHTTYGVTEHVWAYMLDHAPPAPIPAADHQEMTDKQIEEVYADSQGQELRTQDYRRVLSFARAILAAAQPQPAPISAKDHWEQMTGRADARAAMEGEQDRIDAARYRWLRESGEIVAGSRAGRIALPHYTPTETHKCELDAHIDVALLAKKEGGAA